MSSEQSIRDELDQIVRDADGHWPEMRDAILPVIRRIQAEALRDAAEEMDASVSFLNPINPTELSYINCTRIDTQELRQRADRIERGETA